MTAIPQIDPQVKYRGSSYLRELSVENMKALEGATVIQDGESNPLIVIVTFDAYMKIQNEAARAIAEYVVPTVETRVSRKGNTSKRARAIQERAEADLTARGVEREDIDYSDTESTPTTHITKMNPQKQEKPVPRSSMADWRSKRKPIPKRKDAK